MTTPNHISLLLEKSRKEYVFAGYSLYCEKKGEILELASGQTSYWPPLEKVTAETYFDIGSVTKAVATVSILARLVDRAALDLQAPLVTWISEFKGSSYEKLTPLDLLNHSSGILWWYPIFQEKSPLDFVEWLLDHESEIAHLPPRSETEYSDIGFLILGEVIQRVAGNFEKAFQKEVVAPLGLKEVVYLPVGKSIAATEYSVSRKKVIKGEVFDENCVFFGGITAHAGLFATARGLSNVCREWLFAVLGKSEWLSLRTAKKFTRALRSIPSSTWALGWDTPSKAFSSAGTHFSKSSFGHLGYPGTSIWIDPEVEGFAIFLTNRIHPSRFDERIKRVRPLLHDEIGRYWRGA